MSGYSLYSERQSFEQEAIDTLIAEMENKRDKICIIFAGYKKEMQQLLSMNPGFASRINFHIDFESYTSEQLYTIFKQMCKVENYKLETRIKQLLLDHFELVNKQDSFSNGRYTRNIFERIKIEMANRVIKGQTVDKDLIKKIDVENVLKELEKKNNYGKRKIGFGTTA